MRHIMTIKDAFYITVAVICVSAAGKAAENADWSLSQWAGGPRSAVMYDTPPAPVAQPVRWRETRQRYHSRPRRAWDENIRGYRQFTDVDDEISWRERRGELRGVSCVGDRVTGLGTQWIGKQGALDAAKKDWMEHVRYYWGETFLDLDFAAGFKARCSRVSIGETMGQVMYRCEMRARPCRAEMLDGEKTLGESK
jgi:hypothetical protein